MTQPGLMLLAVLMTLTGVARAQNLVINSSFEERIRCPSNFSASSRDFNLPGWKSANTGTPDYYNQCSWGECDVPFNWAGESNAHSGVAYAGIYVWNRPNSKPRSYREYIQGELLQPMKKDKRYRIEFYFKLASYAVYTVDRIGLLLTDTAFFILNDHVIPQRANLSMIRNEPITSAGWELAVTEYVARGGERFLTIGNFFDNLSTQFSQLESRKGKSAMLAGSAYFYIDDVAVIELDPDPPPVVWTDGKEVKPEEVYVLNHIQFEFDQYVLLPVSFPELDRLAKILEEKPQWKAEIIGHTDDLGGEDYNLQLSRQRATSVGQYLISKGILRERLTMIGYGKQRPLTAQTTDEARTLNRRVEVKFVK